MGWQWRLQLVRSTKYGRELHDQATTGGAAQPGNLELRALSVEEGVMFNDEIAAAVREKLSESNYGELLAARGITTVTLDDNGDIVEHRADASWRR